MNDDKRFARMCQWLHRNDRTLHSYNTHKTARRKIVCVLREKKTGREIARH